MKKVITILCVLFIFGASFAQEPQNIQPPDPHYQVNYFYCELVGMGKLFSRKVTVSVDFGETTSAWADTALRDENGERIVFNSMVDAMNYMGKDGWEFVQAYTVTIGQQNVYHWLLKKSTDGIIE